MDRSEKVAGPFQRALQESAGGSVTLERETFDEYRQRLLGYLGDRNPLAVQRGTPDALAMILWKIPDEVLTEQPAPGKWSIAEVVAHLAEGELVLGYRLRSVLAAPATVLAAYDQERWAEAGKYRTIKVEQSLDRFRFMRQWNLELLESLGAHEWDRFGIHAERGRESIRDMARLYAGHDLNHMRQIDQILRR